MKTLLLSACVFFAVPSFAETFTWDAPTKDVDGVDISPGVINKYKLYKDGVLKAFVVTPLGTPAPTTIDFDFKTLTTGSHSFWVTATRGDLNLESGPSNVVVVDKQAVSKAASNPPSNFKQQ